MIGTRMANLTSATNKAAHLITAIPSQIFLYIHKIKKTVAAAIANTM